GRGSGGEVASARHYLSVSKAKGGTRNGGVGGAQICGTPTIHSDGSYTYAIDNSNPTVDALNVGGTLQDTFTYQVSDGQGGTSSKIGRASCRERDETPVVAADYGARTGDASDDGQHDERHRVS